MAVIALKPRSRIEPPRPMPAYVTITPAMREAETAAGAAQAREVHAQLGKALAEYDLIEAAKAQARAAA